MSFVGTKEVGACYIGTKEIDMGFLGIKPICGGNEEYTTPIKFSNDWMLRSYKSAHRITTHHDEGLWFTSLNIHGRNSAGTHSNIISRLSTTANGYERYMTYQHSGSIPGLEVTGGGMNARSSASGNNSIEIDVFGREDSRSAWRYAKTLHFSEWYNNVNQNATISMINEFKNTEKSNKFLLEIYTAESFSGGIQKLYFSKLNLFDIDGNDITSKFEAVSAYSSAFDGSEYPQHLFDRNSSTQWNSQNDAKEKHVAFRTKDNIPVRIAYIQMKSASSYAEQTPTTFRISAADSQYNRLWEVAFVDSTPSWHTSELRSWNAMEWPARRITVAEIGVPEPVFNHEHSPDRSADRFVMYIKSSIPLVSSQILDPTTSAYTNWIVSREGTSEWYKVTSTSTIGKLRILATCNLEEVHIVRCINSDSLLQTVSISGGFKNLPNLRKVKIEHMGGHLTSLWDCFRDSSKLETVDIAPGCWTTVSSMANCFFSCTSLRHIYYIDNSRRTFTRGGMFGGTSIRRPSPAEEHALSSIWGSLIDYNPTKPRKLYQTSARYRIEVYSTLANNDYTTIAEIEMFDQDGKLLPTPVSITASSTYSNYEASRAFDRDPDTHWHADGPIRQYLTWTYAATTQVSLIRMAGRADSNENRTPTSWVLERSDDGIGWYRILVVNDHRAWVVGEVKSYLVGEDYYDYPAR